jgi:nucleotide-binding universal stress UspA family protein
MTNAAWSGDAAVVRYIAEEARMRGTIVSDVTDPEGRNAAAFAYALGTRLGLRVVLAFVVESRAAGDDESVTGSQRQQDATSMLTAIANELGGGVEVRLAVGDRVEALARVAAEEGADLVIVGARAVGFGGRNLRCRFVRDLEAETAVPVLVAPPSTRRRSEQRLAVGIATSC